MFPNCGFSNKIVAKTTPPFGSKLQYFSPFHAGPFSAAQWKLTPIRAGVKRAVKVQHKGFPTFSGGTQMKHWANKMIRKQEQWIMQYHNKYTFLKIVRNKI